MRKLLLIISASTVLGACSKGVDNIKIKSSFNNDVYTDISYLQGFTWNMIHFVGEVNYPESWNSQVKMDRSYMIIPLRNTNTGKSSDCLVTTLESEILVKSCL